MTDCDKCKEYDKEKNYCPVFCNVINDALTDRTIEELEKLKTEFENKEGVFTSYHFVTAIDEHIKELKGGSRNETDD